MKQASNQVVLFFCWIFLLLATLATLYWGPRQETLVMQLLVVLTIAVMKSAAITEGFMELRHAALKWRLLLIGWPLCMAVVIAVTLLSAAPTG